MAQTHPGDKLDGYGSSRTIQDTVHLQLLSGTFQCDMIHISVFMVLRSLWFPSLSIGEMQQPFPDSKPYATIVRERNSYTHSQLVP